MLLRFICRALKNKSIKVDEIVRKMLRVALYFENEHPDHKRTGPLAELPLPETSSRPCGKRGSQRHGGPDARVKAVMAGNYGKNKLKRKTEQRHLRTLEKVCGRVRDVNPIHAPDTAVTL